jgi:hypothetical protein
LSDGASCGAHTCHSGGLNRRSYFFRGDSFLVQAIHVVRAKLSQDADTAFKKCWQLYYLIGPINQRNPIHDDDLYALVETLRLIA